MHEKVLAGFQFAIDQDCQGNWFGNEDGVRKSFQLLGTVVAVQFRAELRVELGVKLKKFSSTFAPRPLQQ